MILIVLQAGPRQPTPARTKTICARIYFPSETATTNVRRRDIVALVRLVQWLPAGG